MKGRPAPTGSQDHHRRDGSWGKAHWGMSSGILDFLPFSEVSKPLFGVRSWEEMCLNSVHMDITCKLYADLPQHTSRSVCMCLCVHECVPVCVTCRRGSLALMATGVQYQQGHKVWTVCTFQCLAGRWLAGI